MALGLIAALHEAGRRVPEDVSVVGFDDLPESAYFAPPLTTVRQDFGELGRRAMGLVERVLGGRGAPRRRNSCRRLCRPPVDRRAAGADRRPRRSGRWTENSARGLDVRV